MYFDFDDRYPDIEPVGSRDQSARWRRRVGHRARRASRPRSCFAPQYLPSVPAGPQPETGAVAAAAEAEKRRRFVFVQPQASTCRRRKPPERAEMSDLDRSARTPGARRRRSRIRCRSRAAIRPSATEAAPEERMRGEGPAPSSPRRRRRAGRDAVASLDPSGRRRHGDDAAAAAAAAARRLARRGAEEPAEVRADRNRSTTRRDRSRTSGRCSSTPRASSSVRGFAASSRRCGATGSCRWRRCRMRGRVVITFYVHRNGALTDVTVVRPSEIESFNTAAVNALLASNPTDAAAAGVSGRQGVLHGHVLLQRIARPGQ